MEDYTHAHKVFRPEWGTPYINSEFVSEIEVFRKSLHGTLFIDRVLKAMGITKSKTYPPKGEKGLLDLHKVVCDSRAAAHHKLSVFYYILLDFDSLHTRSASYAETFAYRFAIPKKYKLFMTGLWQMDHQQFNLAIEDLAHPSLVPEFADDIITVLVQQAKNNDYTLALAYYHSAQPVLTSSTALSLLFEAMARTNLTEAFAFSRTKPEPMRQLLFEQLITSVLDGNGGGVGSDTATRATELVSLPLDDNEEAWFQEYLTTGSGRTLRNAKDTVLMRRVVTGRHGEPMNDIKNMGHQWSAVLKGFKSGMGGRA